jgi:hypothetical protein
MFTIHADPMAQSPVFLSQCQHLAISVLKIPRCSRQHLAYRIVFVVKDQAVTIQVPNQGGMSSLLGRAHVFAFPALLGLLHDFDLPMRQLKFYLHSLRGLGAIDLEHVVLQLVMRGSGSGIPDSDTEVVHHDAQIVHRGMANLFGRWQVAEHNWMGRRQEGSAICRGRRGEMRRDWRRRAQTLLEYGCG